MERLIVLAPSHAFFVDWCQMDCDPPLDPRARWIYEILPTTGQGHGFRAQEGDVLIEIGQNHPGWPTGKKLEWYFVFASCGFRAIRFERLDAEDLPLISANGRPLT